MKFILPKIIIFISINLFSFQLLIAKNNTFTNKGKYYALFISIEKYQDKRLPILYKPIQDAQKMRVVLVKQYTFEEENIIFLKNPNKQEILKSFTFLKDKIGIEDKLLIFYAGVGTFNSPYDLGYWLASDAQMGESKEKTWLSCDEIKQNVKQIDSEQTLLVIDTDYAGSIFINEMREADEIEREKSREAFTSVSLEQTNDESCFFKFFLEELTNNPSKELHIMEIAENIKKKIDDCSGKSSVLSRISGDTGGKPFIFIKR